MPTPLGLLGEKIEAAGDVGGGGLGLGGVAQHLGVQRAGDRRLLDDELRVARMQPVERRPDRDCFGDDRAQIDAGPFLAIGQDQHGILEALLDEEFLERLESLR